MRERTVRILSTWIAASLLTVPSTGSALEVQEATRPGFAFGAAAAPEAPLAEGSHPAVFVEMGASDTSPYVQGEVELTVRIHTSTPLLNGALGDPSASGALLERLGEDHQTLAEVGGRSYHVIERRYALLPQESGPLHVTPAVFEGRVREDDPRRRRRADPFAGFFAGSPFGGHFGQGFGGALVDEFFGGSGRSVRARSQSLDLDVRPKPAEAGGDWWLPARHVELLEQWEDGPPVLRVGEPVQRTVAIRATGLSGAQLPEVTLPEVEGAKQYSEPPVEQTQGEGGALVSFKVQQTALIPSRPGPLTLPEVELAWWDTEADAPRTARLPARTFEVLPGDPSIAGAAAPPAAVEPPEGDLPAEVAPAAGSRSPWRLVGGAASVGFLVALLAWGRRPGCRPQGSRPRSRVSAVERGLRAACKAGDPRAAATSLRAVAVSRWSEAPPLSPRDWSERLECPEFGELLARLQRVQYSATGGSWDGAALWETYRRAGRRRRGRERFEATPIPALYPSHP